MIAIVCSQGDDEMPGPSPAIKRASSVNSASEVSTQPHRKPPCPTPQSGGPSLVDLLISLEAASWGHCVSPPLISFIYVLRYLATKLPLSHIRENFVFVIVIYVSDRGVYFVQSVTHA